MDETTALLELVAEQDAKQLEFLLEMLARSPARSSLLTLSYRWSVSLSDLKTTILRAMRDLDRLVRRQGTSWNVSQVCTMPNLAALADLARARRDRIGSSRMMAICRRIERANEDAQRRKMVINFLAEEPSAKVSLNFLRPLSHPATARVSRVER